MGSYDFSNLSEDMPPPIISDVPPDFLSHNYGDGSYDFGGGSYDFGGGSYDFGDGNAPPPQPNPQPNPEPNPQPNNDDKSKDETSLWMFLTNNLWLLIIIGIVIIISVYVYMTFQERTEAYKTSIFGNGTFTN